MIELLGVMAPFNFTPILITGPLEIRGFIWMSMRGPTINKRRRTLLIKWRAPVLVRGAEWHMIRVPMWWWTPMMFRGPMW